MRRVRDHQLPDPFRAWIDRSLPLPEGVTLLPRTINLSLDRWRLVYPGSAFFLTGVVLIVVMLRIAPPWQEPGGAAVLIFMAVVMFGITFWMALRLWRTIGADRDRKANVLRQGIFVSPEGILIRFIPGRCYHLPLDFFVQATTWHGEDDDYLRIETRDGSLDFEADHLTVDAAAVNETVAGVRLDRYPSPAT